MSETELLRLTFPDRGALEREIANNLRYGRIFVGEILKYSVLTDGVIVIVHPVHGRELKLPAQIVMVNPDGPMKGTGLALRAFGPAEVEQVEAFARELGTAAPAGAPATRSPQRERPARRDEDGSHLASQPSGPAQQPTAAAKASRSEDDWSDLAEPPPRPASDRFGRERSTGSIPQPGAARGRDDFGRERTTGSIAQPEAARHGERDGRRDRTQPAQSPAGRDRPPSGGNDFRRDHTQPTQSPAGRARPGSSTGNAATRPAVEDFSRDKTPAAQSPTGGGPARTIVNSGTRPAREEFSRHHAPAAQSPAGRARPGGNIQPENFRRDPTLPAQTPAARGRQSSGGNGPLVNRAVRPATEINEAGGFDPERTASMGHPSARGRASTHLRPATETRGSPQPSAAKARPGSGVANAAVRPATEVVSARARTDREPDPSSQPTATMPRPGSSPGTPVARPAASPARAATAASSAANVVLRPPVEAQDDWSDFEHGPEPTTAKSPALEAANTNAVPTAPPPPSAAGAAATAATLQEDDWSDFEHGPEPAAARPPPSAAAVTAPAPGRAQVQAQPTASAEEDDWSDFEHGPEPAAAEPAAVAPAPAGDVASAVEPVAAIAAPVEVAAGASVEDDDWSDFEQAPEADAATPAAAEAAPAASAAAEPLAAVAAPVPATAAASVEEDDWSDFEHGPEPSGAPPSSAAELAPPSAAELEEDDRLVLPLGLGATPAENVLGPDPNTAVTIRPAPSDATLTELVERSRAEDAETEGAGASSEDGEATFDEDPSFDPEERNPDLQSTNRQERLRSLNVVEQLKIARRGELADRVVIERMYGKTVWEALLQNPRITLPEVARIARKGTVPRPLLEIILENGAWLRDVSVRRALLSNPKITGESIVKLLRMTPRHELKVMEKGNAYSMAVRDAVKKLLKE